MRVRLKGINKINRKLADGTTAVYYYHRASKKRLIGVPGTAQFASSLAKAEKPDFKRTDGTLAGLVRDFERTAKWRRLAPKTKADYVRVLRFWDEKYGTLPLSALAAKSFRKDVLAWHDEFSQEKTERS